MFNIHFTRIAKEAVKFKRTLKKTDMKRYSKLIFNRFQYMNNKWCLCINCMCAVNNVYCSHNVWFPFSLKTEKQLQCADINSICRIYFHKMCIKTSHNLSERFNFVNCNPVHSRSPGGTPMVNKSRKRVASSPSNLTSVMYSALQEKFAVSLF